MNTTEQNDFSASWQPETQAVRSGIERSQFNEHCEALYLTSSFVFDSAAQAAALFAGEEEGFTYTRFGNPTVALFEKRLAALEGGEAAVATASGMSAILSLVMTHLQAGDHIVASASLFGASIQLFSAILPRFGIETTFVPLTDVNAWRAACKPQTKLFFLESPSNPLTEIADIAALASVAHTHGALLAVDNCFCTPVLQRPIEWGADLIVHSATKYLDGQGRVLGGAVVGKKTLIDEIVRFIRTTGPTLSAFNAWLLQKGMETLKIRMEAQSKNALELATWLEAHPSVVRVYYPGLPSHPQHALASRQQSLPGAIVSFEVKGGRQQAWQVIDSCRLISITSNLGDCKTMMTHPATTTHGRVSPEARAAAGINENLLRISVGLESTIDLKADLARGLSRLG